VDTPAPRRRFDVVAYLKLVRFPLVFTAIADSAAGYMLGIYDHHVFTPTLGLLSLSSAGLNLFGMALNDIADLEKDRVGAPSKVLLSGRVSRKGAIGVAAGLLLISLGSVALIPEPTTLLQRLCVWGAMLLAILAYDLHWVKAPPIMGLVRGLNVVLGAVATVEFQFESWTGAHPWKCAVIGIPIFIYGTSLTYVSTLEDAGLDRRKVMFGVAGMSVGALSATLLLSFLDIGKGGDGLDVKLVPALIAAWALVGWIVRRAWKATDRKQLMLLVRDGVAGYIVVDAVVLLPAVSPIQGMMIAALLVPAVACLAIFKKLA
jgi:4-hydroxybenzoate polyprenyltransferase